MDAVADEWVYYEKDVTNFSCATFNKFLIRWHTGVHTNGLGARVEVVYDDASTEFILGSSEPQLDSSKWIVTSGTLINATSAANIDKIRVYADDYPDTIAAGANSVYYDFLLFYQGTFTFPHVAVDGTSGGIELEIPNRYVDIAIPGRVGDVTQYLGMASPVIRLTGDMMNTETWGGSTLTFGEYLYKLMIESRDDAWQWFTSELVNCKVTPRNFKISMVAGTKSERRWSLELKLYSLSSGDSSVWGSYLFWLGFPTS